MLLLDEPLSALDRDLRERLAADLRTILVATGTTALLVTHDHDEALTVADRLALMVAGRIVTTGPADKVWHAPVDRTTARLPVIETGEVVSDANLTQLSSGEIVVTWVQRGPAQGEIGHDVYARIFNAA